MKKAYFFIFFSFITCSAFAQITPSLYNTVDEKKMNEWVDKVFSTMTLDEKIGQLFMLVIDPNSSPGNTAVISNLISKYHIGGLLFARGNPIDQAKSTNKYQQVVKIPLMIALDGEWGLSMRLSSTIRFPRNMILGAVNDETLLEEYGEEVARQCREMGIHINFAPVLDVLDNVGNHAIGMRSFGTNPERVARCGIAYARGLEKGSIMAVAKHFPGHGNTMEDSHLTTPVVAHDRTMIEKRSLLPFRLYVNAGFPGIMNGHLFFPALDSVSKLPASLSPVIMTELLRNDMQFSGLSFTDALVMRGVNVEQNTSVLSLLAGNDIIVSPKNIAVDTDAIKKAIWSEVISLDEIDEKCKKVLRYKYIFGLNNYKAIKIEGLQERLNSDKGENLSRRLHEASITLLKNSDGALPFNEGEKMNVLLIGNTNTDNFQKIIKSSNTVNIYSIPDIDEVALSNIETQISKENPVVCCIYSPQDINVRALRKFISGKKVILCFFISPHYVDYYEKLTSNASAILLAYENSPFAQIAAANALLGKADINGTLPVDIYRIFHEGTGLKIQAQGSSY